MAIDAHADNATTGIVGEVVMDGRSPDCPQDTSGKFAEPIITEAPLAPEASVTESEVADAREHHGAQEVAAGGSPLVECSEAQQPEAAAESPSTTQVVDSGSATVVSRWPEGPPPYLHMGFAEVFHSFNEEKGLGFLRLVGRDEPLTEESASTFLDYLDAFIKTPAAAPGFEVMYDLREMQAPSLVMLRKLVDFGSQPEREAIWRRLNVACKVIINEGIRFKLCTGILSTFFWMCPPVVETYLLTDPDADASTGAVFKPGPQKVPEPDTAVASLPANGTAQQASFGTLSKASTSLPCAPNEPIYYNGTFGDTIWPLFVNEAAYYLPESGLGFGVALLEEVDVPPVRVSGKPRCRQPRGPWTG